MSKINAELWKEIQNNIYPDPHKTHEAIYAIVQSQITLAQQRTEKKWRDKCKKLKKRKNPHSGHEIDDYYCIECGVEIKTHPDETMGYNKALLDLNN